MTPPPPGPDDDLDAELREAVDARMGSEEGDDDLLARVKARVLRAIAAQSDEQHRTVRAGEGLWQRIGPGIERKMLWTNDSTESWMLRLAAGAVVPAHLHTSDEECVVLEGSLRIGSGLVLHEGDFHVAAQGSRHEVVTTDDGALIYLRGAPKVAAPG